MAARSPDAAISVSVLREIRAEARAVGLREPPTAAYAIRAGLLAPALVGLLLVAWTHPGTGPALLAAGAAGFLCIQLGFVAHDAGHAAVARGRLGNAIAGHLFFTLLNGLGFQSWRVSHGAHHAACQEESRDPDMSDTAVALTSGSAAARTGVPRHLLPYQGLLLWPASLLFAHSLRLGSLSRSYGQPARYRTDVLLLPLHYAIWLCLPAALDPGWSRAVAVYVVTSAVMGVYLAVLFWVNHVGMPALQAGYGLSFLEQQVTGTRNVRNPAGLDWLFGGLNFQIEHHLVPDCPGSRLRELQKIARPLCIGVGLPYREEGLGQAIASVTRHVHRIGVGTKRLGDASSSWKPESKGPA